MLRLFCCSVLVFCMFARIWTFAAHAESQSLSKPVLRPANSFAATLVDFDSSDDGRYLAAAMGDGNAVVWDMEDPGSPTTYRVPLRKMGRSIDVGVAISPDGQHVVVGSPLLRAEKAGQLVGTSELYVFDGVNNKVRTDERDGPLILKVPVPASRMTFSPSGRYLVAALGYGCGVRIWDALAWQLVGLDDANFHSPEDEPPPHCASSAVDARDLGSFGDHHNHDIAFVPNEANPDKAEFIVAGRTGIRTYSLAELSESSTAKVIKPLRWIETPELGLEYPGRVAVNPRLGMLAIGDMKAGRVQILRLDTLRPIDDQPVTLHSSFVLNRVGLSSPAWIQIGGKEYLVAAGYHSIPPLARAEQLERLLRALDPEDPHRLAHGQWANNIVVWEYDRRKEDPVKIWAYGNDSIIGLRFKPDEHLLTVVSSNAVGTVSFDEENLAVKSRSSIAKSPILDFRVGRFAVTSDGNAVRYIGELGESEGVSYYFDINRLEALRLPADVSNVPSIAKGKEYLPPRQPKEIVGDWRSWRSARFSEGIPTFFGKKLNPNGPLSTPDRLDQSDISRAVAVSIDSKTVLWGSAQALRIVRDGGQFAEVACDLRLTNQAWNVAFAEGGTLAIAAHSDSTIRWYRVLAEEGDPGRCRIVHVLTLYAEYSDEAGLEWIAFTPEGSFYTEDISRTLYGWQSTDKFGQQRFDSITEFFSKNFSRDAITSALELSEFKNIVVDPTLLTQAEKAAADRQPEFSVRLLNSQDERRLTSTQFTLSLSLSASEDASFPVEFDFSVEGQPVEKIFNGKPISKNLPVGNIQRPGEYDFEIVLPKVAMEKRGAITVSVAYQSQSAAESPDGTEDYTFEWMGKLVDPVPRRMFAVIVGLSHYDHVGSGPLPFAAKDAVDVAKLLVNDFERDPRLNKNGVRVRQRLHIELFLSHDKSQGILDLIDALDAQVTALKQSGLEIDVLVRQNADAFDKHDIKIALENARDETQEVEEGAEFKDTVLFYFSGHGASRLAKGGNPDEAQGFLILYDNPKIKSETKDSEIARHSLTFGEIEKILAATKRAEKILVIDACRTLGKHNAAIETPSTIDFEIHVNQIFLKITDPKFHVFLSAGLDQKSFGLHRSAFERAYPALYDGTIIHNDLDGNGIFTNIFIAAHFCENAVRFGEVNAQQISIFMKIYFDYDNSKYVNLTNIVEVELRPMARAEDLRRSNYHYVRKMKSGEEISCITRTGS